MTFWAYMLHCRGGAFYIGHTDNLEYRIGQHQSGLIAGYTPEHLPVTLVWSQDFPTRQAAKEAERRIKGWSRAKKTALIRGDWELISMLAKGKSGPSTSSGQTGEGENAAFSQALVQDTDPSFPPARPELVEGLSFSLLCHPQTPSKLVSTVTVDMTYPDDDVLLEFRVEHGEAVNWPDWKTPARRDELWKTTCFEFFMCVVGDPGYFEFNFSPSGEWAAYRFDSYRAGMQLLDLDCEPRFLWEGRNERSVTKVDLELNFLKPGPLQIALSAVIEEVDGTKSYWALAHPPGKPDFHHPDCFALTLPAPEQA